MNRTAVVEIDVSAIAHNYALAKSVQTQGQLMAVVKANAYGHGLDAVVRALNDADGFAVSCVKEGLAVRRLHASARVLVLQGAQSLEEMRMCAENNLDYAIHQTKHIQWLLNENLPPMTIWIKVNTGMNRLGFSPENVDDVIKQLSKIDSVRDVHLMTHMSDADDTRNTKTQKQLDVFSLLTQSASGLSSMANSAALMGWEGAHADWQRLGIALYGVSPFVQGVENALVSSLKPAMRFYSKVIAINTCKAGAAVGYGETWVCERDSRIAVVAVGYGDGYPRHASAVNHPHMKSADEKNESTRARVFINGQYCPLVGRVSMDMITVDITDCDAVALGDQVELWGNHVSVKEVAECSGTIAYDLLCGVFGRTQVDYCS